LSRWRRVLVGLLGLRSVGGRNRSGRWWRWSEGELRSGRRVDRIGELLWRRHVLVRNVDCKSRLIPGWWRSTRTLE
jgi:hypothetical protein